MNDDNFFSSSVLTIMDVSKFMLIGLVLTICALIFQVIGLASPYWIFAESGRNKAYSGLWKSCLSSKALDTTVCNDWTNVQGDQYCYTFFLVFNNFKHNSLSEKQILGTHQIYIYYAFCKLFYLFI